MGPEKRVLNLSEFKVAEDTPDHYVNGVGMLIQVYEFMFNFTLKTDPEKPPKPSVIVRMSPQHAKVFSMLLARNVASYERDIGEIKLPSALLEDLGLTNQGQEDA